MTEMKNYIDSYLHKVYEEYYKHYSNPRDIGTYSEFIYIKKLNSELIIKINDNIINDYPIIKKTHQQYKNELLSEYSHCTVVQIYDIFTFVREKLIYFHMNYFNAELRKEKLKKLKQ